MNKHTTFPIGATITISDLEGNLHPLLHRLRATEPVSWLPAINGWLVTRRADAIAVMRNSKSYTVDHPGFSTTQVIGPSMLSLDGAQHQCHRAPFERPFRLEGVQHSFRQPWLIISTICSTAWLRVVTLNYVVTLPARWRSRR